MAHSGRVGRIKCEGGGVWKETGKKKKLENAFFKNEFYCSKITHFLCKI